jgi:hypothetical protein
MAQKPKSSKTSKKRDLDLSRVLGAIDAGDKAFYSNLSPEEKKAYVPLVLMRYMSVVGDQNPQKAYAIVATNDLVNLGFWQLSKHPELQHMLLCVAGLGGKHYRSWIGKGKTSKTKLVDEFLMELHPGINADELGILRSSFDDASFKSLLHAAGKSDQQVKTLMDDWKKQR